MLTKNFWKNEDKLKKDYKSGKVSHKDLVDELFDRIQKESCDGTMEEFNNLWDQIALHFVEDEDFGYAWKEMIVMEKYPQYFFKHHSSSLLTQSQSQSPNAMNAKGVDLYLLN